MKVGPAALLVALGSVTLSSTTHAFVPTGNGVSTSLSPSPSFRTAVSQSTPSKRNEKTMVMMAKIPVMDNWRVLRSGKLTGVVSNHPTYGDGEVITTSKLADPKSSEDGVVVVTISGSQYQLGKQFGATKAAPKKNGTAAPSKKVMAPKKVAPAPAPKAAKEPPSIEQRLRAAKQEFGLTGASVGDGKYLLAGRPARSTSGKSQIWTAYRADEDGLPTGECLTVKVSANFDAIKRENSNYDMVTNGLFGGRFVKKIEFLPVADSSNKGRMANLCALVIENGDLDLKAFMASRGKVGLTGRPLRDAAAAAGQCVQAMHSSNMVWTDLKTENFVVQQNKGNDGSLTVKGIDLESARRMKGNPVDYSPEACPPEFANAFISGDGATFVLEPSYDMWSLGMMLYEVSVGKPYFDGKSPIAITKALRYDDFEADVSAVKDDKLRDLIGQCLRRNPKERPSITAFLLHPYFLTTGIGPFSF